jgi:heterodisulfide reductase subunit B
VLTCCAACFSRLQVANQAMRRGGEGAARVDEVVEARYRGETAVTHLLDVVVNGYGLEALGARVQKDLRGLRVASYYGCLLVRPPELGLDDVENPVLMDRLVAALGAEPVNWSHKTECCGGSLSLTRTDVVLRLCADILSAAADQGADCLAVACPLCQANLDLRQAQIRKVHGLQGDLPILYFTQLIGLALGMDSKALGLNRLIVSPRRLLESQALA